MLGDESEVEEETFELFDKLWDEIIKSNLNVNLRNYK